MRNLLIAVLAVTATAALPASASAATQPDLPETCDLIRNTICHLIPPTSVEDVCAILDNTSNLRCEIDSTRRQGPDIPTTGCELQEKLGVVNVRQCEDPWAA
jgi:hypothetical protein